MDFEAMIRDAQKNGLTIDDIAKMFSKTLNAVQQEDQKKKAITDELLQALLDKVDTVPKTNKSKDKSDNEKIAAGDRSIKKRGLIPSLFFI